MRHLYDEHRRIVEHHRGLMIRRALNWLAARLATQWNRLARHVAKSVNAKGR